MTNQIGFSNAMKEVTGNNSVTLEELKNDNESYIPLFQNKLEGTEAKKILGKLLANNGGSSDYVMPKNVVVINPDADEVEGKVYSTFAAAKTYMEANPSLKFCVELPAGDFGATEADHITLSEQWEIHGNKTKIVAPIDTKIVETGNFQGIYTANRSIQNCTISEGFVADTGATGIKCYQVYDCVVLKMSTYTGSDAVSGILMAYNCSIDTDDESALTKVSWSYGIFQNCFINNLIVGGQGQFQFIGCMIGIAELANVEADCVGCQILYPLGSVFKAASQVFYSCDLKSPTLCGEVTLKNSKCNDAIIDDVNKIVLSDSDFIDCIISSNKTLTELETKRSRFSYDLWSAANHTLTITNLYADAISSISEDKVVYTLRNANIVYSTDGGSTLTNNPSGATHLGFCKNLSETTVDVSNYIWFPMPN